ncbi:Catsper1 [Symbiodinium sp. CCMP2456]|nr:Catsper1 [Symbiodinium sp. CCMP2456]
MSHAPSPFVGLLDVRPSQPSEPGLSRDPVPQHDMRKSEDAARHEANDAQEGQGVSAAFQSLLDQISQQHRAEILDLEKQISSLQGMLVQLNTGTTEKFEEPLMVSDGAWQATVQMKSAGNTEGGSHCTRLRKQHQGKREMQASQLLDALNERMESDSADGSFQGDPLNPDAISDNGSNDAQTSSDRWKMRLQSTAFEVSIAATLCLNVMWMAVELQIYGSMVGHSLGIVAHPLVQEDHRASVDKVFMLGDILFTSFFALEVGLRMVVFRLDFWKVWSNYIDAAVSVASAVQVALFYMQTLPVNLALLRLLRIGKLARPIRMITMSSVMASLQLLIKCVAGSVNMLFWSMCLLFFLQCVAGMIVSTICRDYIESPAHSPELRQEVFQYFGTFSRTMLTMFEILFANWGPPARVLVEDVSEWFSVFFLLYRCVFCFSILNVVNAVFVQQTLKTANSDEEIAFKQKERELAVYGRRVKTLFQTVDESGDGSISYDEFSKLVQSPKLKFWMSQLELEYHDLLSLFEFLDNGDGNITLTEFIEGAQRLKGNAKALDIWRIETKLEVLVQEVLHALSGEQVASVQNVFDNSSFKRIQTTRVGRGSGY